MRYKVGSNLLFSDRFDNKGRAEAQAKIEQMNSGSVSMFVSGRPFELKAAEVTPTLTTGGVSFTGRCDNTQQATITSALNGAQTYSANAYSYVSGGSVGARFTTWFGPGSSSAVNNVKAHYAAIKDAFDTKPITVDCACKKTYYAYVYPTQPYKIYVCKAFWSAPLTGTDSKSGTLVHEMSHFNATAGTDDWAYGQSAAKSLALSDPAKAQDNADNHEYFAENNPAQN